MNEENNREPRTEETEVINEEINCVSKEEVKNALRRMKKGKAVGPDGQVQGRSKRATLCIRGPREGLRQGSTGKLLHEKIRNSGKVCTTSTGYV